MEASEARRAVDAAGSTAAALGLHVDDVVVVHNSDRIVLRLMPCDVLARVTQSVHEADAQFEVDVARRMAEADGPVAEPEPRVEPCVYLQDGFATTLWTYYEPAASDIAPPEYADALVRLHAALRQIDLATPHFTDRVASAEKDLGDRKRTPDLPDADRALLSDTLGRLSVAVSTAPGAQLLHGEPHPGNLLSTRRGPLFVDLATCCRGPIEFDVAHAPEAVGEHYPGADKARIQQCRVITWALFSTWRWRRGDQLPDRDYWRMEGLNRVRAELARSGFHGA